MINGEVLRALFQSWLIERGAYYDANGNLCLKAGIVKASDFNDQIGKNASLVSGRLSDEEMETIQRLVDDPDWDEINKSEAWKILKRILSQKGEK